MMLQRCTEYYSIVLCSSSLVLVCISCFYEPRTEISTAGAATSRRLPLLPRVLARDSIGTSPRGSQRLPTPGTLAVLSTGDVCEPYSASRRGNPRRIVVLAVVIRRRACHTKRGFSPSPLGWRLLAFVLLVSDPAEDSQPSSSFHGRFGSVTTQPCSRRPSTPHGLLAWFR